MLSSSGLTADGRFDKMEDCSTRNCNSPVLSEPMKLQLYMMWGSQVYHEFDEGLECDRNRTLTEQ